MTLCGCGCKTEVKQGRKFISGHNLKCLKVPAMLGKKHTPEANKKRSESLKGKIPWNKGLKLPNRSGDKNHNWKGGKIKDSQGYILVQHPDHQYYYPEHRIIMEDFIKRPLTSNEIVHHINGIKDDNRIENLKLMTKSEHLKMHQEKYVHIDELPFCFLSYQEDAHKLAAYPRIGIGSLLYPVLGLCGESGEVSEKFKKLYRDHNGIINDEFIENVKKELGDVLWYLAEICSNLKINLEDVAKLNIEKLKDRKSRNVMGGSGDNR